MLCKICNAKTKFAFEGEVLKSFKVKFFKCFACGFLSPSEVHWLHLAYSEAINRSDTGIVARNLYLYKIVLNIAHLLFDFGKRPLIAPLNTPSNTSLKGFLNTFKAPKTKKLGKEQTGGGAEQRL